MNPRYALWLSTNPKIIKFYAFSAWIMGYWREWDKMTGHREWSSHSPADHEAFDLWLESQVLKVAA